MPGPIDFSLEGMLQQAQDPSLMETDAWGMEEPDIFVVADPELYAGEHAPAERMVPEGMEEALMEPDMPPGDEMPPELTQADEAELITQGYIEAREQLLDQSRLMQERTVVENEDLRWENDDV